jgi:hypothetical protein
MVMPILVFLFLMTTQSEAKDPTTVCLPDIFQTNLYSLGRNVEAVSAYDFTQKEVALRYTNGIRLVFNISDFSSAYINETDGSCVKNINDSNSRNMRFQCLPADARPLTSAATVLGLNPEGLSIEGWEFTLPDFGTVRVGVTASAPSVPVIRQYTTTGPLGSDVEIYYNPKPTIDDRSIFFIPPTCQTAKTIAD